MRGFSWGQEAGNDIDGGVCDKMEICMDLQGGDQAPDLPQEMKRSFTASGWRKYQMRQRQRIVEGHIADTADCEAKEAS